MRKLTAEDTLVNMQEGRRELEEAWDSLWLTELVLIV